MKILIAVEDQIFADAIADFAANHKWPAVSEFRIIHVIEPLYLLPLSPYPSEVLAGFLDERERAGMMLVESVGHKIRQTMPKVKIQEQVISGSPKTVIIDTAKDWPADMIIVGSHGRTGLGKFFLGSVSMSVLSVAPCPVMVVKLPQHAARESAEQEAAALTK